MQKDFKNWHNKKSQIDQIIKRPYFHLREIWFCHIGTNVGFENDGKGADFLRPIVIVRKFNNDIFWGIPLTKSHKKVNAKNDKFYYVFSFIDDVKSVAILSQIKLFDAKRLARLVGVMSEEDFTTLTKKLKDLIP